MTERPLSNDDFRKLLATPRNNVPITAQSHQQEATKKTKKPPPARPPNNKEAQEDEEEGCGQPSLLSEIAAKYRDRAAERRSGRQVDQEGIPEDLRAFVDGKSGRDVNTVSYEESKYLGGDEAHTHLVKGLDFALLEKIRREQQLMAEKGGESETVATTTAMRMPPPPPKQPTTHRKAVQHQQQQQQQQKTPPATATKSSSDGDNTEDCGKLSTKEATAMAQGIKRFLTLQCQQQQQEAVNKTAKVSDMFLPRRTTYVYDFSDTITAFPLLSNTYIPVTLHRSKEDCPKSTLKPTTSGALPKEVLQEMVKIMSYVGVDGSRRKKKKKGRKKEEEEEEEEEERGEKLEATVQNVIDNATIPNIEEEEEKEEDIFGNAGTDYVAQRRKPKNEEEGEEEEMHVDGEVGPMLPPGPPTGDDDDDMFAYPDTDAAYAEAETQQPQQAQQQQKKKKPVLFPEAAEDIMAPIVAPKVAVVEEEGEEEDTATLKRKLREQQKKLEAMNEDDGYGECYPSFYENGAMYESDDGHRRTDEEKPTAVVGKVGGEGGKEEEKGGAGGRKKGWTGGDNKDKDKDAMAQERKLAQREKRELHQIKSIFNKKGYKDGGAFDAEDPDKAKKKGGGTNARSDDDAQPMAGTIAKKRRI